MGSLAFSLAELDNWWWQPVANCTVNLVNKLLYYRVIRIIIMNAICVGKKSVVQIYKDSVELLLSISFRWRSCLFGIMRRGIVRARSNRLVLGCEKSNCCSCNRRTFWLGVTCQSCHGYGCYEILFSGLGCG